MNVAQMLINNEKKLRKAKRTAFFCTVLMLMATIAFVMLSEIGGQPTDQKAIAAAVTPFLILMAVVIFILNYFHSSVKEKIKRLS